MIERASKLTGAVVCGWLAATVVRAKIADPSLLVDAGVILVGTAVGIASGSQVGRVLTEEKDNIAAAYNKGVELGKELADKAKSSMKKKQQETAAEVA